MNKQRVLITSALPYANGPLHFGHIAGAYLPGDCYARFQRLMGKEVAYICGSDEHGVAITLSADLAKRTPKAHVDEFHKINRAFFEKLQFSFDHYGRTTWPGHVQTTQDFFKDLQKKGLIEERTENHLYSEAEKRFLADRYVVGTCPKCGFDGARGDECQKCASSYEATDLKNPRSKLTGCPLTLKPSLHLYLRFDRFKEQLTDWLKSKKWKENVLKFAQSYIDDLKPRAITRDSDWGVPVPGYPGKVFYVWFDAPIGYISITQEWLPDHWKDFWLKPETQFVQFIGKDNIPFHAVFFPAMLMGQDLPYKLPDELPANEFLLLEGKQFSKSDGWTIDLSQFFERYTSDQVRYALAANSPETADAEFTWKDFQMRCNAELLGKLGNFVNRVLVFMKSTVPQEKPLEEIDRQFLRQIDTLMAEATVQFETFHLRKACQILMELSQLGNGYFDAKKPWGKGTDPSVTLSCCLECIKNLALLASPIIPTAAQKIWEMLGFTTELAKQNWDAVRKMKIEPGKFLPEPKLLFRKIEDAEIEEEISKLGKKMPEVADQPKPISIDDFAKIELRVAQVLEAEKIPKANKLLKLTLDLGTEKRTVVSGIALVYEPEALIGRKVILVANLAPATIRGVESQGMILAASTDTGLELVRVDHFPPGSKVS